MKEKIIKHLQSIIKRYFGIEIEPIIDTPSDERHGDYSSNIAMAIFANSESRVKNSEFDNPLKLAEMIKSKLEAQSLPIIEKIDVAPPGFINFWISKEYLIENLNQIVSGKALIPQYKKAQLEMIENTQPNTNKPLHIGHLRNTALGVSIVNLRKTIGHNALSVNINNDRGIHIVKAMWAYLAYGKKSSEFRIQNSELEIREDWRRLLTEWSSDNKLWFYPDDKNEKPDHFVGRFYILGDKAEKELKDKVSNQMQEMLKAWEDGNGEVLALWVRMNEWFYQGFNKTHGRFIGIDSEEPQFDRQWYESEIYKAGKQIVLDNLGKGLFYKREDGTILAKLEKYNLPDKVVVRSDGTSVYITQDIELARLRVQKDKAKFIAYIVGDEQDLHFKQLFAICEELGIGKRENFKHISYGMVNLSGGVKMSSRQGTVVTADELMDTVEKKVKSEFKQGESTSEKVALGAIKYWMLRYNSKAKIEFDINESVSLAGNSGPYLQYAYARVQSVIEKSNVRLKIQIENKELNKEELSLLRSLVQYPELVLEAAEKFAPNLICNYLFDLAQKFNLFYQKHKIIGSDQQDFRLVLTTAIGITLKSGLNLLGIETVEKM